ncbi:SMP-30/gluconolactonase/LRE family protein [Georgenia sp. Z1344]|uniref:SMP-30/gluconolactonase/LRE family protein n=1 Tax=Georgenia sp. Z1344 TaxID=3416706 RepID=UPI003CF7127B
MTHVHSAPEQVTDAVAYHGEGPVWSASWGGLRFVDMLAGDLLTVRDDGGVDRLPTGSAVAAFVRPRADGGYVVGTERGLATSDEPDAVPSPWLTLWRHEGLRMNEGGCDAAGNLYAGNMAYDRSPEVASLYRITPGGDVTTAVERVTTSNGFDVSPDGSLAYYNDTSAGGTDVFDVTDVGLRNRRRFATVASDERPDGLTVDSAGNVWVALNRVGKVRLYSPEGAELATVDLPVRLVTACTLGGEDGRDLFVTTSKEKLDDPEPEAGAVFRIRVEVPGRPVRTFGG